MGIIVQKYGGTSVGSVERIQAIADRVIEVSRTGSPVVVVVSAMGKATDDLVDLANQISNHNPDSREYDALISTGESVSAALLSMALISKGKPAVSLTGYQAGIKTESIHSKAKITGIEGSRIHEELKAGKVVVITGFQGFSNENNITTIGRGGSDTSAVVLAAALGSSECEIYTDVNGVYTTDPRIEPKAKKIETISYDEMLEMASLGAGVLHPRAVECAKEHGITLHVRSSFNQEEGTRVKDVSMEIQQPVTGIALKEEAKLSIIKIPDTPNVAAQVFNELAAKHINVDMIIQSTQEEGFNDISFTVSRDDLTVSKEILEKVANRLNAKRVTTNGHIAKLSIVGVGMISRPGIAAKMFSILGNNGINIELISTSEIKISCVINDTEGKRAVQLLHDAFELG